MKSPYPYFGGKSSVADLVWQRFGEVQNYVEPFFGGGAVLLYKDASPSRTETVNDLDCHLCNFWRAVKADPDAVARYASDPVSEIDLHARGDWLFYREDVAAFTEAMRGDPEYYCVKSAGWWVWGICSSIGNTWGARNAGRGLPNLCPGMGVNRKLPHLGNAGMGDCATTREQGIREYMRQLCERTARVRVCCGDWKRVTTPVPTTGQGLTAMFLDPPYASTDRADVYNHESYTVAHDVREYAIAHGHEMRIALCGYEGEHVMPDDWECVPWKAAGSMSTPTSRGAENAHRERIYFSPACLQVELF